MAILITKWFGVFLVDDKSNRIMDKRLMPMDPVQTAEKLAEIAPVQTTCSRYFSWKGENLGAWGEPMKRFSKKNG